MDAELVIHARNGDQQAFATLADALYGRLHQVAYRILRERAAAEDATQQAVLLMWRDLPQLRDPDRFEAWSYQQASSEGVIACWYVGEDGYGGLTAFTLLTTDSINSGMFDVKGWIFPGDPPPEITFEP